MDPSHPDLPSLARGSLHIPSTIVGLTKDNLLRVGLYYLKAEDHAVLMKWYKTLKTMSNEILKEGWLSYKGKKFYIQLKFDCLVWYSKDPNVKKNLKRNIAEAGHVYLAGAKVSLVNKTAVQIQQKGDINTYSFDGKDEEVAQEWFQCVQDAVETAPAERLDLSNSMSDTLSANPTPRVSASKAGSPPVQKREEKETKSSLLASSSEDISHTFKPSQIKSNPSSPRGSRGLPRKLLTDALIDKQSASLTERTANVKSLGLSDRNDLKTNSNNSSKDHSPTRPKSRPESPRAKSVNTRPKYQTKKIDFEENASTIKSPSSRIAQLQSFTEVKSSPDLGKTYIKDDKKVHPPSHQISPPSSSAPSSSAPSSSAPSSSAPTNSAPTINTPTINTPTNTAPTNTTPTTAPTNTAPTTAPTNTTPIINTPSTTPTTDKLNPPKNENFLSVNDKVELKSPRTVYKSPSSAEMLTWNEDEIFNWVVFGLKIKEQHALILKSKGVTGQKLLQSTNPDGFGIPLLSARIIWSELLTIKSKV